MTAVNKAHSVSTEQSNVLVVIKILEYVFRHRSVSQMLTNVSAPSWPL